MRKEWLIVMWKDDKDGVRQGMRQTARQRETLCDIQAYLEDGVGGRKIQRKVGRRKK